MNESAVCEWSLPAPRDAFDPPELGLQAVTTRPAAAMIPALLQAIDQACGWVLEQRMIQAAMLLLRVEAQGRALMDVYAAIMEAGLDLSRDSHLLLTERCSCVQMDRDAECSIVTLRLQVTLPPDLPMLFQWWSCGTA